MAPNPSNLSLVQFNRQISEKGNKIKSTKQLTWLLVMRVHRITCSVSNSIKILKCRAFFKRREESARKSGKILTFLKIIFIISFLTLLFEIYAHWKQWNLGHMIRPHEVTNITHAVYLQWLSIRAGYIAPFVVYLSRFCIVLFLVQSIDRFVQCVGCFWIKCKRLKPVLPKNASSYYPMVLVQIPMCNEQEVELAALFHDIGDYKYMKNSVEDTSIVERFLNDEGLQESKREKILSIIKGMGFKNEVSQTAPIKFPTEFGVVQDADRLDAIGAIGIARCFTYGGSVNQILHDPNIPPRQNLSKEKYMNRDEKQTTINHFHEKLFRLKDLMKTEAGKRRAERRHKFMQDFLKEFYEEWEGKA